MKSMNAAVSQPHVAEVRGLGRSGESGNGAEQSQSGSISQCNWRTSVCLVADCDTVVRCTFTVHFLLGWA